ncbi:MAG TPA: hypothetical protein VKR59_10845 [Terriglobales bacterium]|nr:hypothetical protein [Terriglobales bacterium]
MDSESGCTKATILEGSFIELAHAVGAQVCETPPEFLDLTLIKNVRFFVAGSPSHSERYYHIRLPFA